MNSLVSDLACVTSQERAFLEQCEDLLSMLTDVQVRMNLVPLNSTTFSLVLEGCWPNHTKPNETKLPINWGLLCECFRHSAVSRTIWSLIYEDCVTLIHTYFFLSQLDLMEILAAFSSSIFVNYIINFSLKMNRYLLYVGRVWFSELRKIVNAGVAL